MLSRASDTPAGQGNTGEHQQAGERAGRGTSTRAFAAAARGCVVARCASRAGRLRRTGRAGRLAPAAPVEPATPSAPAAPVGLAPAAPVVPAAPVIDEPAAPVKSGTGRAGRAGRALTSRPPHPPTDGAAPARCAPPLPLPAGPWRRRGPPRPWSHRSRPCCRRALPPRSGPLPRRRRCHRCRQRRSCWPHLERAEVGRRADVRQTDVDPLVDEVAPRRQVEVRNHRQAAVGLARVCRGR